MVELDKKARTTGHEITRNNSTSETRYRTRTRKSRRIFLAASEIMPGGQSHNSRFFEPYPFYARKAAGKYIWDADGNRYVDYWMGHTALILGHSPSVVVAQIKKQAPNGLLYGSPNIHALELAKLVNEIVPCAESIRFCATGAEATMYAVRLARAHTKRRSIVKMAGGWHGYNSALTFGVSDPYTVPESAGLLSDDDKYVRLARFNDREQSKQIFEDNPEDIAGVIVEPVVGAGGVIPPDESYLAFLRDRCRNIGAVLIFDEIITGFRLALGGAQEFYRIKPDICSLGKILGGGLPVSAIAGRSEIMSLADATRKPKTERCWIGGGTFSENALCIRAGIATLSHLIRNRKTIYPQIGKLGEKLRTSVDKTFAARGIRTKSTGVGSLFATHFLGDGQTDIRSPEDVNASRRELEKEYYFSLIADHGIYFIPGHLGAVATVHKTSDIDYFVESTEFFARKIEGREYSRKSAK